METSNTQDIKNAARKLTDFLTKQGLKLSHGHAVEALAQSLGIKDFMTLKGMLASRPDPRTHWPRELPRLPGGMTIMVYTEGVPTAESAAAPPFVRFPVNQEFLERLVLLMNTARREKLWYLAEKLDSVEWAEDGDPLPTDAELHVFADALVWHAFDANGQTVESSSLDILPRQGYGSANLADVLTKALAEGKDYAMADVAYEDTALDYEYA